MDTTTTTELAADVAFAQQAALEAVLTARYARSTYLTLCRRYGAHSAPAVAALAAVAATEHTSAMAMRAADDMALGAHLRAQWDAEDAADGYDAALVVDSL